MNELRPAEARTDKCGRLKVLKSLTHKGINFQVRGDVLIRTKS